MAQKRNHVLWDQWRQRIERQRVSGLSIAAFCRAEGISQPAFYTWKRKFRGGTPTPKAAKASTVRALRKRRTLGRRRPSAQNSTAGPSLPTRSEDFLQLPVRGVRTSPWIEMTLADGALIRVPQENVAALIALLKVLRGDDSPVRSSEVHHA